MSRRRPLYSALLHLQHLRPGPVQRFLLGEGALILAGLIVLADLASAWLLLVLPLAVAAVVKTHDVLAGRLRATPELAERAEAARSAEPSAGTDLAGSADAPSAPGGDDAGSGEPEDQPQDQLHQAGLLQRGTAGPAADPPRGPATRAPRPAPAAAGRRTRAELPDLRRRRTGTVPPGPTRRPVSAAPDRRRTTPPRGSDLG